MRWRNFDRRVRPDEDAGFGLLKLPAFGLLGAVMTSAERTVAALVYMLVELRKQLVADRRKNSSGRELRLSHLTVNPMASRNVGTCA